MNKNDWNHLLISIDIMENLSLKRQIYPFQKLLNSRSEFSNFLNGRKKYIKISSIVDSKGAPLSSVIVSSKQSDSISVNETVNAIPVNLNTLRNSKVNRYILELH